MRIVYAINGPRRFEFHLTDNRRSVSKDATIFAICTKDQTIENQDEDLFELITDQEYYTVRQMVAEAERLEKEDVPIGKNGNFIRRFYTWLSGLLSRRSNSGPQNKRAFQDSSVSRRSSVVTRMQQGY
ncbi:MAG TPA: hypothetical protein VM095_14600 [Pyrinomonadaceae bacterium]|nr:hypothetical protein [Pyrinomonadaceae bacterium]